MVLSPRHVRHARALGDATPTRPVAARPPPPRIPVAHRTDHDLTPRERAVEAHLLDGAAQKQIAAALGISRERVKQHAISIYRKRGVGGCAELIARHYRALLAERLAPGATVLTDEPCLIVRDGALVSGTCTGTFTPSTQP